MFLEKYLIGKPLRLKLKWFNDRWRHCRGAPSWNRDNYRNLELPMYRAGLKSGP